jgi:hypothetical protein
VITGRQLAFGRLRLSFYANQWPEARDSSREPCLLRHRDDGVHVLVGARSLFGNAAGRWAPDQDSLRGKIVDDAAPAPLFQRGMPRKRAASAVSQVHVPSARAHATGGTGAGRRSKAASLGVSVFDSS